MRRARQASRSPECIRAQQRGRRYFSSTAAATSARPPSVERPMASANSAMQNSATNGAPSPANVRPVSPPGVIHVAASSIDSGGCCSAQVTAATIRSAWARWAAAWLSRANTSTSRAESRCSRSVLVVVVMDEFKHRALTETGWNSLLWKGIPDSRLSLRSGLVVPVSSSASGEWFRLSARFALCSTTSCDGPRASPDRSPARCSTPCWYGPRVSSDRSLRSLLDHLWCGRPSGSVVSRRSLRSLLNHRETRLP